MEEGLGTTQAAALPGAELVWHSARIVAQQGVYAGLAPKANTIQIGPGASAKVAAQIQAMVAIVPVFENYVTLETGEARLELVEIQRSGIFAQPSPPLEAQANTTIRYTRVGDLLVLLDAEQQPHRFRLIARTNLPAGVANGLA